MYSSFQIYVVLRLLRFINLNRASLCFKPTAYFIVFFHLFYHLRCLSAHPAFTYVHFTAYKHIHTHFHKLLLFFFSSPSKLLCWRFGCDRKACDFHFFVVILFCFVALPFSHIFFRGFRLLHVISSTYKQLLFVTRAFSGLIFLLEFVL